MNALGSKLVEIGLMVLYMNLITLQTDRRTDKQKEDGQQGAHKSEEGGLSLKNRRPYNSGERKQGGGCS